MASNTPKRLYLLTHPRTASNLLTRILALDDQTDVLSSGRQEGNFFFDVMALRWFKPGLPSRHINTWTQEERQKLRHAYQSCFEAVENHAGRAESLGKSVFVKEHVPWLCEPVTETRFIFGNDSVNEPVWMVETNLGRTRTESNETVLPDEFLQIWCPTFLIRHPALVFPSLYRTAIGIQGTEAARNDEGVHKLEMTVRCSRRLYDWYLKRLSSDNEGANEVWSINLDADDVMTEPKVILRYAEIIGFDPTKLRFSWGEASKEDLNQMGKAETRMRSTLIASTGIVEGKTAANLNLDEEARKWRIEFGEDMGGKVEGWVREAMPDCECIKERRLKPVLPIINK
ncbi:hypothetical protein AOQ84DRAFT_350244 [Glonium stellatum]|uniref:Sulfotransferase n=1 Tax=Glonium stellatum TaxID=574774 RepID=A0A8E2JLL9_9PEZI|nr:hypothetical protein AOQ84DRAFT_350244 [Glonium stellatum]